MIRFSLAIGLAWLLAAASVSFAQIGVEVQFDDGRAQNPATGLSSNSTKAPRNDNPRGPVGTARPEDHDRYHRFMTEQLANANFATQAALAEDVEILGRIVAQNLLEVYDVGPQAAGAMGPVGSGMISGVGGQMSGMGGGAMMMPPAAQTTVRVSGQYVPGVGVTYQIEAPPPSAEPKVKVDPLRNCGRLELSRWERAGRELRGELKKDNCRQCHHVEPAHGDRTQFRQLDDGKFVEVFLNAVKHQAAAPTKTRLIDTIVKTLVENGGNINYLQSHERLIVAITFQPTDVMQPRAAQPPTYFLDVSRSVAPPRPVTEPQPQGSDGGPKSSALHPAPQLGSSGPAPSQPGQPQSLGAAVAPGAGAELNVFRPVIAAPPGSVATFDVPGGSLAPGEAGFSFFEGGTQPTGKEAIGDLHFRQGNHAKAIEAYEQATREWSADKPQFADVDLDGRLDIILSRHDTSVDLATLRRLMGKLLQSHIAAGNLDRSEQLLKTLKSFARRQATAAAGPRRPMPARLVISMSRAQLNVSADEKANFDKVRAKALVYSFDPSPVGPVPPSVAPGSGAPPTGSVPQPPKPGATDAQQPLAPSGGAGDLPPQAPSAKPPKARP